MNRLVIGTLCVVLLAGCGKDDPAVKRFTLSSDQGLYPPTCLTRTPSGDLVALVGEGEQRTFTLFRSETEGRSWSRWCALPTPNDPAEVDLIAGGNLLIAYANLGRSIWIATLQADPEAPGDSLVYKTELPSEAPIRSLSMAAPSMADETLPELLLSYQTGDPADSLREMFLRHSNDGGITWSEATSIAEGVLGDVCLERPAEGETYTNMIFSRDRFLRWQGIASVRRTSEFEIRVRVPPESPNRVAHLGNLMAAVGVSSRNQVVAAGSTNKGRNWEVAIALARDSDHPRHPDLDGGFGRFWVTYLSGDSLLMARTANDPRYPKRWSRFIWVEKTECLGWPSIVALPDSLGGVLYAVPGGKVRFARLEESVPVMYRPRTTTP